MIGFDCVIPTYNHGELLTRCVVSVLGTRGVQRVIVVDDGGSEPARINDSRVTLIRNEVNAGPSAARNRGLAETRAGYVVLLDGDDVMLPGVQAAIELAERMGAAAVVSARTERSPDGGVREKGVPTELAGKTVARKGDVFRPIAIFGASGVVVSRKVIEAGVRFDEMLRHGEDREFLRRVADVGPIAVNPVAALEVTMHPPAADNLNSMKHLGRRIEHFARVVEKWRNAETDGYFREGAEWLLNQGAKRGVERAAWEQLVRLCERCGWRVPLKARFRRRLRKSVGS